MTPEGKEEAEETEEAKSNSTKSSKSSKTRPKSKSKSKPKSKSKSNSKSKSKSHSQSKSHHDSKSKTASHSQSKSNPGHGKRPTKPSSKKSIQSIGVGSRMKSISSRKSIYKPSVGRIVHSKAVAGSGFLGNSSCIDNGSDSDSSPMYSLMYGDRIYDTVQVILVCPVHKKVALSGVEYLELNGLYLPFHSINHGQTWKDAVGQFIQGKLLRENVSKLSLEEKAKFHTSSSSSSAVKSI